MLNNRYKKHFKQLQSTQKPPIQNELFQFYKEYHDREITRKQEVEDHASNTVSTMALVFGIVAFYVLNFPDADNIGKNQFAFILFIMCGIFGLGVLGVSAFFMYHFYSYGEYKTLDKPSVLNNFYETDLEHYCANNYIDNKDAYFFQTAKDAYIYTADYNATLTDERANSHYKSRKSIFIAFGLLVLTFIPYAIVLGDELNMSKLEIHKSVEIPIKYEKDKNNGR